MKFCDVCRCLVNNSFDRHHSCDRWEKKHQDRNDLTLEKLNEWREKQQSKGK